MNTLAPDTTAEPSRCADLSRNFDEAALVRQHGLCAYSLATAGWQYAGGFTVQEGFRHSNGAPGVYVGDEAGYIDEQPLLGRPTLIWMYDEFYTSYGPFVSTGDSDDYEHLIDILTESLGGRNQAWGRQQVAEAIAQTPTATSCGYPSVAGAGTEHARCIVHVGMEPIEEATAPSDRRSIEAAIRHRQVNETAEREARERAHTAATADRILANYGAQKTARL